MKKTLLLLSMMCLCISGINAQQLEGTWSMNQDGKETLGFDSEVSSMDFLLRFEEKNISVAFNALSEGSDIGAIGIMISTPGSFTQTGNVISAEFDKSATKVEITDMELNDPDMKALISTPEGKAMMKGMLESAVKDNMGDALKAIGSISDLFNSFTIKTLTEEELVITFLEQEVTFLKKK